VIYVLGTKYCEQVIDIFRFCESGAIPFTRSKTRRIANEIKEMMVGQ